VSGIKDLVALNRAKTGPKQGGRSTKRAQVIPRAARA